MKTLQPMIKYLPLLFGACAALSSCEHKNLCFDHDQHAPTTKIEVRAEYEHEWQYTLDGFTDWKTYPTFFEEFGMAYDDLRPVLPTGLRTLVYNNGWPNEQFNLPPKGGRIGMSPGGHPLLFYNNDTEYIVFDELSSYASATASTRTRTRATYIGNEFAGSADETTVNCPDMLYASFIPMYEAERTFDVDIIDVLMRPLVYTYLVRYEFSHGVEYVALARGALSGMAAAVYLNDGRTADKEATLLFDDCSILPFGVQANVHSFGIPDYPNDNYSGTRAPRKYALNLEVRLKNGKIMKFDFDVTRQVAMQPHGGVITVSGINITYDDGKPGSSGFDVTVDGWGEYEDIDIPLG